MEKKSGMSEPLNLTAYQTQEIILINPEEINFINPGLHECTVVLISGQSYRVHETFEDIRDLLEKRT